MHRYVFKPRPKFHGRGNNERMGADDAAFSDLVSVDLDAVGATGRPGRDQIQLRSAFRDGTVALFGWVGRLRGLDGFMKKGAVMRRATCLGLVLAALTHASGCGFECDMDRDFVLTVEPVDEAGVHLPFEALEAALDAGKIEICVDGHESYCHTDPWIEFIREKRVFELTHSDLAYPERRHCELPTVTFRVEFPGCEPGEYVLDGGETTNQVKFEIHTGRLEVVCPDA